MFLFSYGVDLLGFNLYTYRVMNILEILTFHLTECPVCYRSNNER